MLGQGRQSWDFLKLSHPSSVHCHYVTLSFGSQFPTCTESKTGGWFFIVSKHQNSLESCLQRTQAPRSVLLPTHSESYWEGLWGPNWGKHFHLYSRPVVLRDRIFTSHSQRWWKSHNSSSQTPLWRHTNKNFSKKVYFSSIKYLPRGAVLKVRSTNVWETLRSF